MGRVTIWRLHMEIKMWGNCTGSLRSNVRSCRLFLNQAACRLRKDHILCLHLHVTEVFTHVCERRHLRVIASRRSSVVYRSWQDVLNKLLNRDFKEYLYRNKDRQRYPARNESQMHLRSISPALVPQAMVILLILSQLSV